MNNTTQRMKQLIRNTEFDQLRTIEIRIRWYKKLIRKAKRSLNKRYVKSSTYEKHERTIKTFEPLLKEALKEKEKLTK